MINRSRVVMNPGGAARPTAMALTCAVAVLSESAQSPATTWRTIQHL